MNSGILRGFLHRSREWARATRGIELLEMAAIDLFEFAEVDSGFFVYRKRAMIQGRAVHEKANVYAPWGLFKKDIQRVNEQVELTVKQMEDLSALMERWMLVEDMPTDLYTFWMHYGALEVGIWPLVSREQMVGAMVVMRSHPISMKLTLETGTALMDICAAQISLALELIHTGRIAEEASQRDLLTGLLNRRGFEVRLSSLLQEVKATGKQIVFGLIDVNDLKQINDSRGHPAGDEALRQVADILKKNVRQDDIVARFGGDEFAVVLQFDHADADLAMLRIQKAVEHQSDGYSVSVGGVVWHREDNSFDYSYRAADVRLYESKRRYKMKNCEFI